LELVGGTDLDQERAAKFCALHNVKHYPTLGDLLADPSIEMVVNLTYSSSHYEVSKACLEAGKHLYTEKPLATKFPEAKELVQLAEEKGVYLSAAPCSLLGEAAQTMWKALRNNEIGKVRLVYGELDDGPLHLCDPHTWRSESGAPYAYRVEFEVGVTIEHAGYYLGWLSAFFGPAKTVTAFSQALWPDKQMVPDEPLYMTTPDFSVACITFESGVVARITTSLVGRYNHVLQMIGDKGVLSVDESWSYSAPVHIDRYSKLKFRVERYPITKSLPFIKHWLGPHPRTYPPVRKSTLKQRNARYRQDYSRGIGELARAIVEERPSRLPADFCLHVNELVVAIQHPTGTPYQVTTTFKPLEPLDEAGLNEVIPRKW
jgi:predicted dehydrogenase